jgi:hypothetical protein
MNKNKSKAIKVQDTSIHTISFRSTTYAIRHISSNTYVAKLWYKNEIEREVFFEANNGVIAEFKKMNFEEIEEAFDTLSEKGYYIILNK